MPPKKLRMMATKSDQKIAFARSLSNLALPNDLFGDETGGNN
jgi:hypothetical protein